MAPELKSRKRKAAVADDEVEATKKEKKVTTDVPVKKRKTAEDATSEVSKKSKATKAAPVTESPKPKTTKKSKAITTPVVPEKTEEKPTKKSKAITTPIVPEKTEEKPTKKAKAEKPLSENRKKLKAMKEAPDAEAKALKEKEAAKDESTKTVIETEEQEDSDIEMDDQTEALLKGFESGSDDEKDTEDQEYNGEPIPEITKKAKNKLAKLAAKNAISAGPGTVYLGRIPHGFYENEMRQYFKQFGDITQLRLSRNRKTGNSKHYAFIQFSSGDVAEIVSKTMDNYLLFGHILKCKVVPQEQVHATLWEGANKRFKKVPWNKMAGRKLEIGMTEAGWDKRVAKEQSRREAKAEKMKAIGYEFKAPELKSVKDVPKRPREPLVPTAEAEEEKVAEEPKVVEEAKPVEPVKESKRKAEATETEEPTKKKQKKLRSKASSDKLNVVAKEEKPAAKPVAEKKAEQPAKVEKKTAKAEKPVAEKKAEKAEKPAKKAKKTKA